MLQQVYLVGVHHGSRSSVLDAAAVIRDVKPGVVVLELDKVIEKS
jgi:pheromone shutdown protein TraB